jgi:hypothetical protein
MKKLLFLLFALFIYTGGQTKTVKSVTKTDPPHIYVRIEFENHNYYYDHPDYIEADAYLAVYSDVNCTQPLTLSAPLTVPCAQYYRFTNEYGEQYNQYRTEGNYTIPAGESRTNLGTYRHSEIYWGGEHGLYAFEVIHPYNWYDSYYRAQSTVY